MKVGASTWTLPLKRGVALIQCRNQSSFYLGRGHRPTGKNVRTLQDMSKQALSEISSALGAIPPDAADRLCAEILQARRIACYGVGREGLMMNALCMRLMHLGL